MSSLGEIVTKIEQEVLNPLIGLLIAAASLIFIWGVIQTWIAKGQDPEQQSAGRQHMIWGLVGLVIMVSAFGIIRLIASIF